MAGRKFSKGGLGTGGAVVEGLDELIALMEKMRTTRARGAFSAGAGAAAQKVAKVIKKDIPTQYKQQRKMIGWRRLKVKEAPDGGAKVGGRVGASSKQRSTRTSGKGVGIGARNIHWFMSGTKDRTQPTPSGTGRYVGKMWGNVVGPVRPVKSYASMLKSELKQLFARAAKKHIANSIKEGKAFPK